MSAIALYGHSTMNQFPDQRGKRKPVTRITPDDVRQCFDLPQHEAAKKLGISQTFLKRLCRAYGITRWPYRQLRSLQRKQREVQVLVNKTANPPTSPQIRPGDLYNPPEAQQPLPGTAAQMSGSVNVSHGPGTAPSHMAGGMTGQMGYGMYGGMIPGGYPYGMFGTAYPPPYYYGGAGAPGSMAAGYGSPPGFPGYSAPPLGHSNASVTSSATGGPEDSTAAPQQKKQGETVSAPQQYYYSDDSNNAKNAHKAHQYYYGEDGKSLKEANMTQQYYYYAATPPSNIGCSQPQGRGDGVAMSAQSHGEGAVVPSGMQKQQLSKQQEQ